MPPIVLAEDGPLKGQPVLRCINHYTIASPHELALDATTGTTMEAEKGWNSLIGIEPPRMGHLSGGMVVPGISPRSEHASLNFRRGQAV